MKKIVLQCMARGEDLYFKEWIEHHLNLGFDHIYIYDNNDDSNILPELLDNELSLHNRECVTIIPWKTSFSFPQNMAVQHFIRNYGKSTDWALSLDLDEFLHLEKPLLQFLEEFDYASQVYFSWENFGADGRLNYSPEPVMQRFITPIELNDLLMGKCMFRPKDFKFYAVHSCGLKEGSFTVNARHEKIEDIPLKSAPEKIYQTAWIKHYFTKSLEEWENKIKRGCADSVYGRRYDLFFELNPDLAEYKNPDFQEKQGDNLDTKLSPFISNMLKWRSENSPKCEKTQLRKLREKECFAVVDRAAWYDELTPGQKADIKAWRNAWLDVTDTMVIPETPEWLTNSTNKTY